MNLLHECKKVWLASQVETIKTQGRTEKKGKTTSSGREDAMNEAREEVAYRAATASKNRRKHSFNITVRVYPLKSHMTKDSSAQGFGAGQIWHDSGSGNNHKTSTSDFIL